MVFVRDHGLGFRIVRIIHTNHTSMSTPADKKRVTKNARGDGSPNGSDTSLEKKHSVNTNTSDSESFTIELTDVRNTATRVTRAII